MKRIKLILSILVILLATSCETHYRMVRMVTTLERNGKVHREVYAHTYKVEQDTTENPFLFHLTSDWKITRFDTAITFNFFGEEANFRMKINKNANSIEQFSREIQFDEDKQSFAKPEESLVKKFRWFYTYYSFKTVYKKLQYETPIPIEDYLSKDDQILWTQGDMKQYKRMNGYEVNDYLHSIDTKFWKWYRHNAFELSFEAIKKRTTEYNLDTVKESIYKEICRADIGAFDADPESICSLILDTLYKTTYFSQLYKTNKKEIDKEFETAMAIVGLVGNIISYELVIPDKLIKTDAPIVNSDTLIWKVDGMRLLFDDYTLTAEYRTANRWAFVLSGLVVLIAMGCLVVLWRKRR